MFINPFDGSNQIWVITSCKKDMSHLRVEAVRHSTCLLYLSVYISPVLEPSPQGLISSSPKSTVILRNLINCGKKKNTRLVFGPCYSMHSVNSASFGLPLPVRKVQTFRNYSESIFHLHFTLNLIQVGTHIKIA